LFSSLRTAAGVLQIDAFPCIMELEPVTAAGGAVNELKFKVILHKEEDGGYSVSVPVLNGCFSQGKTWDEAVTNAREAILCHVESLMKDGEPLPHDEEFYLNEVEVALG